jgi:multiple sugar transport system permease protein
VYLSVFEWNMLPNAPMKFAGAHNYENLYNLPKLWQALRNTGVYIIGLLPIAVLLPLAIAIYIHDMPARWRNIYRALIFVPMIIAPAVAAAVWRWLLDPGHGIVNLGLQGAGARPVGFFTAPKVAIWTIIFITGWKLVGFSTLILSAANADNSVVQIGIQMFMTTEGTAWGPLMAASTMASAPILLLYVVLQRQVIQSFMKSGLR